MPDTSLPPAELRTPTRRRRRWGRWLLLMLLLAGGAGYWRRDEVLPLLPDQLRTRLEAALAPAPAPTPARPGGRFGGPVPVTVAAAARTAIPVTLDALGTVTPVATITVRAQVEGQLLEVAFTEGQEVKRGDLLARIDPRTYQAALAQVTAKQAQNMALLNNARADLARYTELARTNGTSRQQLDTQRALVGQYEALVQADQAAIDSARTQLDFTTIRAPVDGRVGLRLVDPGNLVRPGEANGLVVVTQLRPMTVVFTLPQQRLPAVLEAMARGPLPVLALEPDGGVRASGVLLTLDNQVDQATGTIKLKAQFANDDNRLWPGSFVNVRLQVNTLRNVLAVPLVGVLRGPEGPFAFVVQPDETVRQQPLSLGLLTPTHAVVTQGLAEGERVVTSGSLRLNPGAQVVVLERPPGMPPVPPGQQRRQRPQ
jgi:multidrug efflux system membrane fusion protein